MRFLMIEDHPLVRASMVKMLKHNFPDAECLEHNSFERATIDLKHGCPDLILLDLTLPGIHGLEALNNILLLYPKARIVVMSGSTKVFEIQRSLDAGAKAYLSKTASTAHMVEVIKKVLMDERVQTPIQCSPALSQKIQSITDEYKDILQMIASGKTQEEIAQVCGVAGSTMRAKCRHIYQLLGVNNRTQAIREGFDLGIL